MNGALIRRADLAAAFSPSLFCFPGTFNFFWRNTTTQVVHEEVNKEEEKMKTARLVFLLCMPARMWGGDGAAVSGFSGVLPFGSIMQQKYMVTLTLKKM